MSKKIVIAGSSGFIGTYFTQQFKELGYDIIHISRQSNAIHWNDKDGLIKACDNAEMVINLAGKSVNCRYTQKNKDEIMRSRVETTRLLGEAIKACVNPPKLWLNSSTATIYRDAYDKPQTESDGEIGKGFSVDVATAWEKTFYDFNLPNTRQVSLRITIVLGKDGGVIPVYKNLVKFGLGGKQGTGKQMFSWMHIEDLFNAVLFVQQHTEITGPVNCAAPHPVTNAQFMLAFRKSMHKKIGLPASGWMLKIGAFFMGTETELILKSRWVLPQKLTHAGFTFKFPEINNALTDVLKKQ